MVLRTARFKRQPPSLLTPASTTAGSYQSNILPPTTTTHLPTMPDEDIHPPPTAFSSPKFVMGAYWSPLDLIIGAGAIILDPSLEKVLILYDIETKRYRMPWAAHEGPDIGQFVLSPFDQITQETGLAVEKILLPKLVRFWKNPDARDWRELQADTKIVDSYTDDPFFTSFDIFWSPMLGDDDLPWLDSRQRMIMWFACRAVSGTPASEHITFVPFADAEKMLGEQAHPDTGGLGALRQLVDILQKQREAQHPA